MSTLPIPGDEAWGFLLRSPNAQWADDIDRFGQSVFTVSHTPKFAIARDARFFCIGSCFARNIEEHLLYSGLEVLSKRIVAPIEEWSGRSTGLINKFTSHSILNEIEWLASPPDFNDPSLYAETGEGWLDLQLAPGVRPVTFERAVERRRYMTETYFARLKQADVVVMTLGLVEVWRDERLGVYLNAAPSIWSVRRQPGRYTLEVLDVAANVAALESARAALKALRPDLRFIVTVSPVPMAATFTGVDVVVANTLSKSTLRAAANAFVRAHDDVDYFPSYEIVTHSPRDFAYGEDRLHVTDRIVGPVTDTFTRTYIGEIEPRSPGFRELPYLAANPDVEAAVRDGTLESGLEHWLAAGQAEGRALTPETPSELMRAAAAV